MKTYVLLSLLFLAGLSCRSSRNTTDSSLRAEQAETKKEVRQEQIRQEKQYLETEKKETNTFIDETTRIVTYDPASGNVQSIQETRRQTGRNELADGSRSGTENTKLNKTSDTDIHSETKIESDEHKDSQNDSRPVQGIEWGYIAAAVGVVILIIWLIKRKKQ